MHKFLVALQSTTSVPAAAEAGTGAVKRSAPTPVTPPGKFSEISDIALNYLAWGGAVAATALVMLAALKIMAHRKDGPGRTADGLNQLMWIAGGAAVFLSATPLVNALFN